MPEAAEGPPDPLADPFVDHRDLLFTVAYEMLGSAADAEDVLQEAWLRWTAVDHLRIDNPRAYAVRIVTRLALNQMRTLGRRRETYVGPWLPEPLRTAPDVAEDVALADSVSMAMLVVLETLSPTERAVFVLREVFGFEHAEIAEAVGKSPAAVRQVAHRAREHVEARRPGPQVEAAEHDAVTRSFLRAATEGDVAGLLEVLAPDVVLTSDGGGVRRAALRPIVGAEKVLRFLDGLAQQYGAFGGRVVSVNGAPAVALSRDGELDTVVSWTLHEGRVAELFAIRNPAKLTRIEQTTTLRR